MGTPVPCPLASRTRHEGAGFASRTPWSVAGNRATKHGDANGPSTTALACLRQPWRYASVGLRFYGALTLRPRARQSLHRPARGVFSRLVGSSPDPLVRLLLGPFPPVPGLWA